MKRFPTWLVIVLIIALVIGSKFLFFSKNDKTNGAAKPKGDMPVAVNYYITEMSDFSNDIFATGKIGALNEIDLVPEVGGKVSNIYFKEGETVQKGTLLVKLYDADLQAQLLKTKTQMKLSQQKLERLNKLLAINGISQEEHDMQENEVMTLKADEAYITAQIAKTSITAPFAGVVGLRNISEGSYVNNSTPIVSLVQLKPLYVEFSIPEKYSSMFKQGGGIKFATDENLNAGTYTASIYAIEPRVDENTKTIRARAIYNGEHRFYPGSFVKVFVDLGKTSNAIMVPTEAVIGTLKGQKVFVNKGGVASEVHVKIGVRTDQKIQITEGLAAGDTVITTGLLAVKKGSKLKLIRSQK
jgi:membrane fusion protein (multidrug efflux system)